MLAGRGLNAVMQRTQRSILMQLGQMGFTQAVYRNIVRQGIIRRQNLLWAQVKLPVTLRPQDH